MRKIRVIFMKENFKNSYLPVCAYPRISSGTKVDQLEELYKISWKTPILTHITLVNTVRVYRVFFPPKIILKISLLFLHCFPTQDLQNKKRIMKFCVKYKKIWIFEVFFHKNHPDFTHSVSFLTPGTTPIFRKSYIFLFRIKFSTK